MSSYPFPSYADRPLSRLISLEGRTAVVTGAARGIGQAIARRLTEAGAEVHGLDWSDEAGNDGIGVRRLDVRDHAAVRAFADHLARLDIWVNDAGILPVADPFDIDEAEWSRVVDTNLTAVFFGCQAAASKMRAQGNGGVIVNIASSLGFHSVRRQPHYVCSKWGVRGLTAALANDFGEHGIRVVAVGPGLTDTPGIQAILPELNELNEGESLALAGDAYAAGRVGEPDDIARAVLFAASDLAGFVTASTILADGGEVYAT